MRQERTVQASIFDLFAQHEIGCELKKASTWLDEHPTLLGLVAADLRRDGVQETGRQGLPAEAVLRCALLKQYRQLTAWCTDQGWGRTDPNPVRGQATRTYSGRPRSCMRLST